MPRFVRRQRERQTHPKGVAGFDRNRWPTSVGTGGRIASESVAGLARITQIQALLLHQTRQTAAHNSKQAKQKRLADSAVKKLGAGWDRT